MGTADLTRRIRAKGRLCYAATDLTTAFPHGGTAIGAFRDMVFHFGMKTAIATAEEWGGITTKAWYAGEQPFLVGILRDWDNDALNTIFPNTATRSGGSGDRYIKLDPGVDTENRAGYDLDSGKAIKLIFSPDNLERDPFIIVYQAIPAIDEAAQMALSMREEVGLAVVFWVGVDSSTQAYRIGRREDINADL